jgi:ribonuclease D
MIAQLPILREQVPTLVKPKGAPVADIAERLVTEPEQLASCVADLTACGRFGLDTEFIGEKSYHPHLCLVQVATKDALYLIDPLSAGPLDSFWQVVVDPASEVIVHAGREEIRLCCLACGKPPANLVDLQLVAGLVGLPYPLSHGNLVKEVLSVAISKGETLTEWAKRPLTRSQIRYAFDDVRYLLPIWKKLSARLDKHGRREWAREECDRLISVARPHVLTEGLVSEKWRKLRGVGGLDRRRLAMVRELFVWREESAASKNRPARTIVRDDLLVEIARRGPTQERDLDVIRGLPKRDFGAIIEAVQRGRDLPLEECPPVAERDQDPPQVLMVTGIMMAVLADLCAKQQLAANLVGATQDVKLLVRARWQKADLPADSQLTRGWRKQHILPDLLAVLEGGRTISVADIGADGPLQYSPRQ